MTPLQLEINVHYRELDTESGPWDGTRVRRLCRTLQVTEAELASFIRVPTAILARYALLGRYPKPIRLLLDLIERSAHSRILGTVYKTPLLPHLPNG